MRTFIHVSDIADSFVFAINNLPTMIDNVYNVGADHMNFSKEDVCKMIAAKTNAFIHFEDIGEDADKRNYIVSYDKINSLGFKALVSMEEGVDEILSVLKIMDFEDNYTNARFF